jgi:outer membrane lipoprotein LolB
VAVSWARLRRWLAPLTAALVLSACATRPAAIDEMPWTSGRLSIRVEAFGDAAARSVTAAFDLRGNGERGELRLTSPLGTLVAAASWAPGVARLNTAEGETQFGDLDTLSQQALGEPLPLAALPDWLAGRPWPNAASERTAEGFEQLGWRVTLTRWGDGFVDAERLAAPTVKLRARIER